MTAHAAYDDIAAVLFDMDGVIYDTETLARRAFEQTWAEYDIPLPDELYRDVIGRSIANTVQKFIDWYGDSIPLEPMMYRVEDIYRELTEQPLTPKPGFHELVAWLHAHDYRVAVASSGEHDKIDRWLRRSNIRDHFELIAGGDEVEHAKPAPDIVLLAAQRLNLPPQRCLVLEDSEHGIRGANTAGMRTIMVPDLTPPAAIDPSLQFTVAPTLDAVIDLLESRPNTGPALDPALH
ncbi:MAG: HAD family phosphatase [Actinomycetes bacterium]|jgi:HAD superfamily hydrolase (TIGR01509 family)|nr:HAD family phosphatase [Actinomycetes bacterium]